MGLLSIIIAFIAIFCSIGAGCGTLGTRKTLLYSVITFSLLIAVMTEVLSCFHLISYPSLFICWSVINLLLILYLYRKKQQLFIFISSFKPHFGQVLKQLSVYEKILLSASALLLTLIFVQGIAYPPNNRDSLTYHMARIPSWISHHSVAAFPTHILRQIYQPPLAEYMIMHVNLLSHGDYFSASVQFFFFIFCAVTITLITRHFGLGRKYQIAAFLLALTLPEGILQASSTQNDVVAAFFVLSTIYFMLRAIRMPGLRSYFVLGISTGLAILTKGTAYLYLAPVLLIFGINVLAISFRQKQLKYTLYISFIVVLPLLLNLAQYQRNYSFSGNLLGVDKNESKFYGNEQMNPRLFICNAIKNADLHMGLLCVPRITYASGKAVHQFFRWMDVDPDDSAITYPGAHGIPGDAVYYNGMLAATYEDVAPNFVHFWLLSLALVLILWGWIKHRRNIPAALLTLSTIGVILIFCGYLKWQTIGTRLQTGIFLMGVPLICYAASMHLFLWKTLMRFIIPFCMFYGLLVSVFNFTRPYITHYNVVHAFTPTAPTAIVLDRYKKMFAANAVLGSCKQYRDIKDSILQHNYKSAGLILGYNDWEYPLFVDCYTHELNPVHIMVTNYSRDIKGYDERVDCIISTIINKPFIDYKNKRFYNETPGNSIIWLYEMH